MRNLGTGNGTYGATNYQYNPSGTPWTFNGASPSGSGIAGNGSGFTFGNPNAPAGTQVGFLQEYGTISQSVNFTAGSYTLSFEAAQRANWGGAQSFQVLVDGQVVGTFLGLSTAYTGFTTNAFTVTAGNHTITFQGLDPNGGDDTAFIDQVQINVAAVSVPAAPSNLAATSGNAQVALSWNASSGATSYDIYRGTSSGSEALVDSGITASSFTDTGLSNGTTYYYEVTAVNAGGQSSLSSQVSATPQAASVNTIGDAGFESPNVGTGAYGDFQYDPSGVAWNFSGSAGVAGNGSGFTSGNPNAPAGTQVGFLQSTGFFSQTVNLAAGSYQISFQAAQRANWGGAQSFQVLVDGQVVGTFSGLSTAYTGFTTNAFTVTAGNHTITFQGLDPNGGDDTAFIDQAQINVAAVSVPAAPSNLAATSGNAQVALSWNASSGATSYDIYRGISSGSEALVDSGITASSFTDTGLSNGTTCYYEVTAVNAGGQSGMSSEVSATPELAVPAARHPGRHDQQRPGGPRAGPAPAAPPVTSSTSPPPRRLLDYSKRGLPSATPA